MTSPLAFMPVVGLAAGALAWAAGASERPVWAQPAIATANAERTAAVPIPCIDVIAFSRFSSWRLTTNREA
jgi:hypothetical protein